MKITSINKASGEATDGYIKGYGYDIIDRILEKYRGFLWMQETLIELFRDIAYANSDTPLVDADNARKIMAKKKPEKMKSMKDDWFGGSNHVGLDVETANSVWGLMEYASSYLFSIAHAGNYSYYSVEQSWFKANHPINFAVERMNIKPEETPIWLRFLAVNDFPVNPPRINQSTMEWTTDGKEVFAPITVLDAIGDKAKNFIKGRYKNIKDFDERVQGRECHQTNKLFLYLIGYFEGIEGTFDDLETQYEVVETSERILVYKYKSKAQKRNDGKVKRRKNKETNKMEEYIFVGQKELVYSFEDVYELHSQIMNGVVLYDKEFANILQKLFDKNYEVSIVTKIKEDESSNGKPLWEIYVDGNDKKPKFKVYQWQLRIPNMFLPEKHMYIAYQKDPDGATDMRKKYSIKLHGKHNGKRYTYNDCELIDITNYLRKDLR